MTTANPNPHSLPAGALGTRIPLSDTLPGRIVLALSASAFVALCAHASIHLPFTPVPITLSDFAVLLVGLALSPSTAFAALVLYLAEGAAGAPVFNPGPGGIAQLLGPTGGYLFAYPLAAALAGWLSRRLPAFRSRLVAVLFAAALASTLIMTSGVVWLSLYAHHSFATAFYLGATPFLPGQIVKVAAAAGIMTAVQRLRRA